jgi:carbamoyl-phosphate synthase large subunit
MKKKALVTGIGGDIGQSVIKCLRDARYPLAVYGCDMDPYAAYRNQVKKFLVAPSASGASRYLDFIARSVNREGIDYIFPVSEPEIAVLNSSPERFNGRVKIFALSRKITEVFFDKYDTVMFLKRHGLPYPKTALLEEYAGDFGFPLIVKPRRGSGGKRNHLVKNKKELQLIKSIEKNAIAQEVIGTDEEEYTGAVFSDKKQVYSIFFRRKLGYGSLTKTAELVDCPALTALAKDVAKATGLEGSMNIQLRRSDGTYIPFEINPRFSSTVYIRSVFGFQDVKWWIDLHEGRAVKYRPLYKAGVAVRSINEVFYNLK